MTEHTRVSTGHPIRRLTGWISARQQSLSDRAHARGDAYAVAQGWTVTAATGRFGFGTRTYRDPRFDARAQTKAVLRCPEKVRT